MNDLEFIAPMVVMVVAILTVGGVLLLRPISKRLAELLEVMARNRVDPGTRELERMTRILESVEARLTLLEERQDFTEAMLQKGERKDAFLGR